MDAVAQTSRSGAQISVVIPAYRAVDTLPEALASAFAQTHPPLEVIVVDDGSDDGTAELVEQRFPAVRLVRQANQGPAAARNRAVALAQGDWVAFLDADDRWHPDKLADQLSAADEHPGTVLVATDWVRWRPAFEPKPAIVARTRFGYLDMLELNRFQTSTVLVRTAVVRTLGGFLGELDGVEDWDLWLRVATAGGIVKLDWAYVLYRDLATGYSKDLPRVYRRMLLMLTREQHRGQVSEHQLAVISAWHYLRFAVAYALAGQRGHAVTVLAQLEQAHLLSATPEATARYLFPFLARRATRRLRRLRAAAR